jgi:hypothetical protein
LEFHRADEIPKARSSRQKGANRIVLSDQYKRHPVARAPRLSARLKQ